MPVNETIERVIERWLSSTSPDANNLMLSHFIGFKPGESNEIFHNSLKAVISGRHRGGVVDARHII